MSDEYPGPGCVDDDEHVIAWALDVAGPGMTALTLAVLGGESCACGE